MDIFTFLASIISSIAWPVVALVALILFRAPIGRMVERLPKRLKAGPLEIEWPEVATEARVALATAPEARAAAPDGSLTERLAGMAAKDPSGAIITAWAAIEDALRAKLEVRLQVPVPFPANVNGVRLARLVHENKRISDATLQAIEGLSVLRNLAAHGRAGEVDREKALDYLTLADSILYAISADSAAS